MKYLEQTHESYNSYYKMYRAAWCKKTGLPMYSKEDWPTIEKQQLYSKSRGKREKVQIDETKAIAWYRTAHGYTPLFKAKGLNDE